MKEAELNNLQLTGNSISLSSLAVPENSFRFFIKNEEIILLDEKGFNYKGELIEDAGEVYKLFKEYLQKAIP